MAEIIDSAAIKTFRHLYMPKPSPGSEADYIEWIRARLYIKTDSDGILIGRYINR
jgi:hypothetical protein